MKYSCHVNSPSIFLIPSLDGSDLIQQWSKFNMGTLASGPSISDERETEGQPSGQTTVSDCCGEVGEAVVLLI